MSTAHSYVFQFPLPRKEPPALPEQPVAPPIREELAQLRASLSASLQSKLSSASELMRALERDRRDEAIPTTVDAVDRLLGGGLPRAKMTEITARRSKGRFSAVLSTIAAVTSIGEAAALIDLGDHLDPQAAEAAGVELERLLWVRPQKIKDAVAAAEMLIATGFQLVVLDLGMHPVRGRKPPEGAWVRLARSAQSHGTALVVSSPYPITGTASEAVLAIRQERAVWQGSGKTPRLLRGITSSVSLEKHRHRKPGETEEMTARVREAVR